MAAWQELVAFPAFSSAQSVPRPCPTFDFESLSPESLGQIPRLSWRDGGRRSINIEEEKPGILGGGGHIQ